MEIDLNHAVTEVEKNAFCDKGACASSPCSSNSSSARASSSYLELWHACAGPLASLPKKGNVVVYFPQGHLEQLASFSPFSPLDMPTYDLRPQIFCRVVNVHLLVSTKLFSDHIIWFYILCSFFIFINNCYLVCKQANKENDEVYTQVTLLPQAEVGV